MPASTITKTVAKITAATIGFGDEPDEPGMNLTEFALRRALHRATNDIPEGDSIRQRNTWELMAFYAAKRAKQFAARCAND